MHPAAFAERLVALKAHLLRLHQPNEPIHLLSDLLYRKATHPARQLAPFVVERRHRQGKYAMLRRLGRVGRDVHFPKRHLREFFGKHFLDFGLEHRANATLRATVKRQLQIVHGRDFSGFTVL